MPARSKAAVPPDPPGARYAAAGKPVTCPHCHRDTFHKGSALLNTAGLTFLDLDWLNRSATTLACARCGLIQWFVSDLVRLPARPARRAPTGAR